MAEKTGDFGGALAAWREAAMLLPDGSRQRLATDEKIRGLSGQVGSGAQPGAQPWWKKASSLGPVGVGLAFLGKAKFLLLGFTKLGTLLSFFVSLSVYWALWGWQFALGLLLSIYVHEMGHVYALSQYGIAASAPMFIPGFGALVRLKQNPASAVEDARVGLAGPVWGLGACLASLAIYALTGNTLFAAVATVSAMLNLFNLIPVWQLDGSRGIRSLTAPQVWILAVLTAGNVLVGTRPALDSGRGTAGLSRLDQARQRVARLDRNDPVCGLDYCIISVQPDPLAARDEMKALHR